MAHRGAGRKRGAVVGCGVAAVVLAEGAGEVVGDFEVGVGGGSGLAGLYVRFFF